MRIFHQLGKEKWEWGQRYLSKWESGDRNGVKIDHIPIPARGLIPIPFPVPISIGSRDFFPRGAGNPCPIAITTFGSPIDSKKIMEL